MVLNKELRLNFTIRKMILTENHWKIQSEFLTFRQGASFYVDLHVWLLSSQLQYIYLNSLKISGYTETKI